jgi:hypothetical protein
MAALLVSWSLFALSLVAGCLPASWLSFPPADEARQRSDPTETQVFHVPVSDATRAARMALFRNGFDIDLEGPGFIAATERALARTWSWDYAAGIYMFEEDTATTRMTIVIKGAPDIFMPLTLGITALGQLAEARQMRIQLFDTIRAILEAQYY